MEIKKGKILVIDDNKSVLDSLKMFLEDHFEQISTISNPNQIHHLIKSASFDIILLDMNFAAGRNTGNEGFFWLNEIISSDPQVVVIMITAYSEVELAVRAIKEGAFDFIPKPWENHKLLATMKSALKYRQSKMEIKKLKQSQKHLSESISREFTLVKGPSEKMKTVYSTIGKVAATDANVLITGENGTGKELFAREIHRLSELRDEIFMPVDLGSLSDSLIESELFGHVKGAFTDAKEERIGKLEAASGGTLFLDEIGNLTLSSQSKLLSVLQNRTISPLGSNKMIPINIRLICATNMDLQQLIAKDLFRQDLLYRINTIHIAIPSLRERKEDIPALIQYFLKHYKAKYKKPGLHIPNHEMKGLKHYSWPGNIRELQHSVEKAVILSDSEILHASRFIPENIMHATSAHEPVVKTIDEAEKQAIILAIKHCSGNLTHASEMLQIGRQTLYNKIKKYQI